MACSGIRPVRLTFFGRTFFAICIWVVTRIFLSVLPNVEFLVFSRKSKKQLEMGPSAVLWGWGYQLNGSGIVGFQKLWGFGVSAYSRDLDPGALRYVPRTIRDSDIAVPSQMIVLADGSRFGRYDENDSLRLIQFSRPHFYWSMGFSLRFAYQIARRHSLKTNILFADGHVASETPRQMLFPSVENWTRFNFDNQQHWEDSQMEDPETWNPPTPWDELLDF